MNTSERLYNPLDLRTIYSRHVLVLVEPFGGERTVRPDLGEQGIIDVQHDERIAAAFGVVLAAGYRAAQEYDLRGGETIAYEPLADLVVLPPRFSAGGFRATVVALAAADILASIHQGDPMPLRPFADRLVLELPPDADRSKAGLHIPQSAQDRNRPDEGTVVAVGPGRRLESGALIPPEQRVGMRIIFHRFSGAKVQHDGVEYLILKENDALAEVIEGASVESLQGDERVLESDSREVPA